MTYNMTYDEEMHKKIELTVWLIMNIILPSIYSFVIFLMIHVSFNIDDKFGNI